MHISFYSEKLLPLKQNCTHALVIFILSVLALDWYYNCRPGVPKVGSGVSNPQPWSPYSNLILKPYDFYNLQESILKNRIYCMYLLTTCREVQLNIKSQSELIVIVNLSYVVHQMHVLFQMWCFLVWFFSGTAGNVEHGDQYQLRLVYEHNLQRTACNMTYGPFGGVTGNCYY